MSSFAESLALATGISASPSAIEGILHELTAISVFALSAILWHYVKSSRARSSQHLSHKVMKMPSTAVPPVESNERPSSQKKCESPKALSKDDVEEAEQQLGNLLQQKEFTRALCLFRSLERDGRDRQLKSEELFSSFVVSAIRVEKFDVVEKMLRVAKCNGVEFTLRSWKTMLKMLSTKKRWSTCLLAYSIFDESIPADQVVFSCLVNAALDSGKHQEATKLLSRYGSSDLQPIEWILFFRTYAAIGDVDKAEATFHKVGAGEMTPLMLNLLLLTCVNANQLDRAETCLHKAHELEQAKGAKIVNIVAYNTIIKGFVQQGRLDHCFTCLQGLFEHGLELDETTVGMMVDICLQDDCIGFADRLVKSLRESGAATNTVMCTHFMKLLIRTDRLKDASELYEEMKLCERTRPDIITCSMLIKAYAHAHNLERALSVFDDMVAAGCKPDEMILTRLLDCCRQAGESSRGIDLFERFVKMGVAPSDYTVLTLLKLLGSTGNHTAAHDLVAVCQQRYGTRPSVIHYTCLMSGALRSKNYQQAWQAYLLMCQHGVSPDVTTISTLLPGLVAAQMWERALEVVSSALKDTKLPLSIPSEMLNNALSQMIAGSAPGQDVLRLRQLMQGASVPITARNAQHMS